MTNRVLYVKYVNDNQALNSKDDGASAFTISLTDRTKHYYPAHLYSYEAVDRLSRGRHTVKSEEWKKLRESILGSTENKQEPFFNGYIPNFYFKPKGGNK